MKGKRRKNRQNKRWKDNIKELTGMNLIAQLRQLKTGLGGKGLFYLLYRLWCPNDHLRLWDGLELTTNMVPASETYISFCAKV